MLGAALTGRRRASLGRNASPGLALARAPFFSLLERCVHPQSTASGLLAAGQGAGQGCCSSLEYFPLGQPLGTLLEADAKCRGR